MLAAVFASVLYVLIFGSAYAHGDHPSTHGGTVGRGDEEIVVEFVMENGTISLYVHDEAGKPLAINDVNGTLTLVPPQHSAREVKLVTAGYHKFTAPGIEPAQGDRLRARITLASGQELESVALFSSRMQLRSSPGLGTLKLESLRPLAERPIAVSN
jgi:hypothetical protein